MRRCIIDLCALLLLLPAHLIFLQAAETQPVGHIIINEGAEHGWTRVINADFPVTGEWVAHKISFTAPHSGKVQFLLNSTGGVSWFDSFTAEGANFTNGDFEQITDAGAPASWMCSKRNLKASRGEGLAHSGASFLKAGTNYVFCWLAVEANVPVTVSFYIRSATPPEAENVLDTEAAPPASANAGKPAGNDATSAQAVECSPRSGLPNFFAKCQSGGKVRVAYLGGSITCQAGWRVQSMEHLKKLYPQTEFEEIYAAIGGTGANLGVFRLERDVIKRKPDLLFVEFASNGGDRQAMEGIVRSVWTALPECDICYIYTVAGDESQKLLEEGKLNRNAALYETIAEHYGIPSVHMGVEAARLARAGELAWKAPKAVLEQVAGKELDTTAGIDKNPDGKIPFSNDGSHPYLDTGHRLYMAALERSLPAIKSSSGERTPHKLPAPMQNDYIKDVSFHEASDATLEGGWVKVENPGTVFTGFSGNGCPDLDTFLPSVWRAQPGASLSFKCKGSSLMLYTVLGPGTGAIEVSIDGKGTRQQIFDGYGHVWRLSPVFLKIGGKPGDMHEIKITVLSGGVDKRAVLAKAGQEKKFDANPTAYEPTDLVIGGICIEGGTIEPR